MPEAPLFDEALRAAAAAHARDSHLRWLALSEEPAAAVLRTALEGCWRLAGGSRHALRQGLLHERWGQHVGALAHLLALGLFAHEGYSVECEPALGGQAPDLLARRGEVALLVEVRAITGCGLAPWDEGDEGDPEAGWRLLGEALDDALRGAPGGAPRADRRRKDERDKARRALERDLSESVANALQRKADGYRELCRLRALPFVIAVYQDTDDQLAEFVCTWAFGEPPPAGGGAGGGRGAVFYDPGNGAFAGERQRLEHVSAVLVFGREAGAGSRALLRGELIHNPFGARPLPAEAAFPDLRACRLVALPPPPRMRWQASEPGSFAPTAVP